MTLSFVFAGVMNPLPTDIKKTASSSTVESRIIKPGPDKL